MKANLFFKESGKGLSNNREYMQDVKHRITKRIVNDLITFGYSADVRWLNCYKMEYSSRTSLKLRIHNGSKLIGDYEF